MTSGTDRLATHLVSEASFIPRLQEAISRVIVGQPALVERLFIGLLCNGHILIEGVPGLAKTLAVRTLAYAIDAHFQRIQFTPDLLPGDLVGTMVYNPQTSTFSARKGPIFANIILADEINRAPAKVQSALLEAMQERQVTIGDSSYPLDDPFMVLATQNPIEQEGTYRLPEAQVDRFMLKLTVGYPTPQEERLILDRMMNGAPPPAEKVVTLAQVRAARELTQQVRLDDALKEYLIRLVFATREPETYRLEGLRNLIAFGASPRATIYLAQASKAYALLQGRGYVIPDDIKAITPDVLRHRIIVTYEAEVEEVTSDAIIERLLRTVEVP